MRRPYDSDAANPASASGPSLAPFAPPAYQVPPAGAYGLGGVPSSAGSAQPGNRHVPTFFGLLNALKRRWVLGCFLGLLAGLAAAAGLWLGMPEGKHQVKGLLEVLPATVTAGERNAREADTEAFKRNQELLIRTKPLMRRVAENPRVAALPIISGSDDPSRTISDMLEIRWPTPDIMALAMNGNNPDQMRIALDELMKLYAAEMRLAVQADRDRVKTGLEQTKKALQQQIGKLEQYQRQVLNGVPPSPQERAEVLRGLTGLHQIWQGEQLQADRKLRQLKADRAVKEAQLKALAAAKIPDARLDAALSSDPNGKTLQATADAARQALEAAKGRFVDENHPRLNQYRAQVQKAEDELAGYRESKRAGVEKQIREDDRAALERELAANAAEAARTELNMKDVKESADKLQEQIDELNKRSVSMQNESKMVEMLNEQLLKVSRDILDLENAPKLDSRVTIREEPQVHLNYNLKQKMVFSSAVAVGAFLGVLALVAFLEWRSRRVDGVEAVVNDIGLRVLGTIPAFPSRASIKAGEADANQNWRFILNESVNSTRTMLLHSAKSQSMQVIMVTSAMQGEGKTSLASQLATSMATAGLRTLILDFDLRNPSMHRLFDVNLSPGVSEVVLQELDVSDAVQPTTVPNLWLIPAGQCSNRVVAALAQGHPLETLFNRLRGQFDFVVVDTCPVLPVADALLIGQHVDGAVISILQDISQLPKVMNASERLTQLNIPLLGAVVNGIKTDIHAYGYNYVKQLPA